MAIIVNKEEKRRAIALACSELLLEHGINDLTISQIAETAGVGKGTIYEYFENKEDIVFDDVDAVLENIPKNIYRVKGVIKVKDVPNAIFVNYSFGDVSFEELPEYEGKSLLIFIGEDIDRNVSSLCDTYEILNLPLFSTKA